MIDPVTNKELAPGWKDISTIVYPEPHEISFTCLVLLTARRDDLYSKPFEHRVHVGKFNSNVAVVGGAFDYDMPQIIAWHALPEIYKEI